MSEGTHTADAPTEADAPTGPETRRDAEALGDAGTRTGPDARTDTGTRTTTKTETGAGAGPGAGPGTRADTGTGAGPGGSGGTSAEGDGRLDELDARLIALVRERRSLAARLQQARIDAGGGRVHLAHEMRVLDHYGRELGRHGTQLAMTLLGLCRVRS